MSQAETIEIRKRCHSCLTNRCFSCPFGAKQVEYSDKLETLDMALGYTILDIVTN